MVGDRLKEIPDNAKAFANDIKNDSMIGALHNAGRRFGAANRRILTRAKGGGGVLR